MSHLGYVKVLKKYLSLAIIKSISTNSKAIPLILIVLGIIIIVS